LGSVAKEVSAVAGVRDVAAYILDKRGSMTAMKLQKLCYYSHAWSLVWDERPLFDNRIEAWANGPVVVDLYRMHRGRLNLSSGDIAGDPGALTQDEVETVDAVLEFYGGLSAHQLSELTHRERPWRQAREDAGLSEFDRGNVVITDAAIYEYYDGLTTADE
jgi:uncharacterized phage-associated protein